jgi:hypothetical protein
LELEKKSRSTLMDFLKLSVIVCACMDNLPVIIIIKYDAFLLATEE